MDVKIYVGPLSRYLRGDWSGGTPSRSEPGTIHHDVQQLQEELSATWNDTSDGPCRVETLSLDDYGRIMLAASYGERPDLKPRRRVSVSPSQYASSGAYVLASRETHRYPALLGGVDWWVPTTTRTREVREVTIQQTRVRVSSLSRLVGELSLLNVREIGITSQDFTRLAQSDGKTNEKDPLKRATGTLLLMARLAESRNLPLIVDVSAA